MAATLQLLLLLVCAGALLHLAWRLLLMTILWAPSAAAGAIAGWHIAQWTEHTALSIFAAITIAAVARMLVHSLLAALLRQLSSPQLTGGAL